jgi:hypothetical protein
MSNNYKFIKYDEAVLLTVDTRLGIKARPDQTIFLS